MDEAKKIKVRAGRPGLDLLEAEGEELPEFDRDKVIQAPSPTGRRAPSPRSKTSRTPKTVPTRKGQKPLTPATAPAKVPTPKTGKAAKAAAAAAPRGLVETTTQGRETLILTLDGNPYDTGIPTDLPDVDILNQILLQEEPGDAEILATILNMATDEKGWDYSDMIEEEENLLRIDPEGTNLNGSTMIQIIDALKSADQSVVDFLQSLDINSYLGPGTFTGLDNLGTAGEGVGIGEGEGEEGSETPTDIGLSDTESQGSEGSEESEGTSRFAGEAGQKYLDRYLSGLRR